jgi:hypothetical protein
MQTSFVFEEDGWYNITLTVRDALSREASQRFMWYLKNPPPMTFILHVGPLYNEDNMIISGAEIILNFEGDIYRNSTNGSGIATFNLSMIYLRADVNITIEAEGYEILTFDTYLRHGSIGIPLPKMKLIEKYEPEKEKAEKGFPTFIVVLLIIFILLILIAVTIYIIKRKQKAEGLEE